MSISQALSDKLQPLVIQRMPHLVFVKEYADEGDGIFRYANPAMARFYGCEFPDEILGKTDRQFSPNDPLVERFCDDDRWVILEKKPKTIPREQVQGFGEGASIMEPHWLSTFKMPLDFEGKTLVVGVSTFIDELVRQEQEQALVRRNIVWELVATQVRHRMGNLLAKQDLILDQMIPKTHALTPELRDTGKGMKQVLRDLMQLQKAGDLRRRDCQLQDILTKAADTVSNEVQITTFINGQSLNRFAENSTPLYADDAKLTECFLELLINSQRWGPPKNCQIHINVAFPVRANPFSSSYWVMSPSRSVTVTVSDNGPGIPEDEKESIFLPNVTKHPHGTGLGLAIIKEVVEAHGGSVVENGSFGKGARFVVNLPVELNEKLLDIQGFEPKNS